MLHPFNTIQPWSVGLACSVRVSRLAPLLAQLHPPLYIGAAGGTSKPTPCPHGRDGDMTSMVSSTQKEKELCVQTRTRDGKWAALRPLYNLLTSTSQ
eukprot:219949-Amphidinium_carterae.2